MGAIENDLFVVIRQMQGDRSPQPRALQYGLSEDLAYRVLRLQRVSETSEAYLILANDRGEVWFISNKHLRAAHGLFPARTQLRFRVEAALRAQLLRVAHSE